ncbi:flap endonuclease-1 [Candidatus Woesearchaeota archaeon]|jgi:flap endonuclease-1|nr:flap endonuclease-1 [Candidatus Woesearchaeota archaeon]MBT5215665.1 flap endonuclease-1 [Candidatus Woesearchaeota archaeon]MBT6401855.1 flap endonuclease-1 [Candidatus Woesearchaeota archaeon]MBT7331706.1 flap endonuclease-1 [Candidatus Woesearchaeota archaeon]
MGVKITDLVEKRKISFDELKGKKIAVDFSNAAYQFLTSIRQQDGTPLTDSNGNITSHLIGILSRTANLMAQGIKVVYVMDGRPPELKLMTQKKRYEAKTLAQERFEEAKEQGDEASMLKYSRQFTKLTKEMTEEARELIEALGIPTIQAPSEADAQIAYCCKQGDVWAAATTDFDVLLHASPRMVTNLTVSQKKKTATGFKKTAPDLILLDDALTNLEINQDQLISLGMLVGTDYHQGIKGIGPKKAIKIVKELITPEEIFKAHPLEDQDWKEVFKLFKNMNVNKDYKLEWNPPNKEKLMDILVKKHDFSEERIMSTLNKITGGNVKVTVDQKGLGSWM